MLRQLSYDNWYNSVILRGGVIVAPKTIHASTSTLTTPAILSIPLVSHRFPPIIMLLPSPPFPLVFPKMFFPRFLLSPRLLSSYHLTVCYLLSSPVLSCPLLSSLLSSPVLSCPVLSKITPKINPSLPHSPPLTLPLHFKAFLDVGFTHDLTVISTEVVMQCGDPLTFTAIQIQIPFELAKSGTPFCPEPYNQFIGVANDGHGTYIRTKFTPISRLFYFLFSFISSTLFFSRCNSSNSWLSIFFFFFFSYSMP